MGLKFLPDPLDTLAQSCKKSSFPEVFLHLLFYAFPVVFGNDPVNPVIAHDGEFPVIGS